MSITTHISFSSSLKRRFLRLSSLLASSCMTSIILLSPLKTDARIITAANGTTAAIQTAVSQASSGDTVRIPAGTFSFSGSVTLNAGINIIGSGRTSTILNKSGSSTSPMFLVNGSNGQRTTMAHFTLVGIDNNTTNIGDYGIRINSGRDFHVHDITFRRFGYSGVNVNGISRGVIRNCSFLEVYRATINNLGYGVVVYADGNGSWTRPLELGGENAVFIEDCFFRNNRHAVASNNGARYVFRHNTVTDNASNFHPIDVHGREYGSPRGGRSYEIYGNSVDNSARTSWCHILIRGGDGVIFDNTFLRGTGNSPILLANRTDGGHNSTTYPAPDQTRELHVWNNKISNGNIVGVTVRGGHESFFRLNRDFFHQARPGYQPYPYPHPLSGPALPTPPAITSASLPDAAVGSNYSYTLTATGGETPYSWSVSSGILPAGLQLSSAGVISGKPSSKGSGTFTVRLTDGSGTQSSKQFSLIVKGEGEVNLANAATYRNDCKNFGAGNPVEGLWDGDISGSAATSPGTSSADSIWVEYDLGVLHRLSSIRLFGDADGSWISRQYSVLVKSNSGDNYSLLIDKEDCFDNKWFEKSVTANARFVRLVVYGDKQAGSVQVRQFEIYGTEMSTTSTLGKATAMALKPGIIDHAPDGIIRYSVPQAANVRLTVHDLKGRIIAIPFNMDQTAGIHELRLSGNMNRSGPMASGHYFYRLSIGQEIFSISKPHMKN